MIVRLTEIETAIGTVNATGIGAPLVLRTYEDPLMREGFRRVVADLRFPGDGDDRDGYAEIEELEILG